jgi:hypothetical protein
MPNIKLGGRGNFKDKITSSPRLIVMPGVFHVSAFRLRLANAIFPQPGSPPESSLEVPRAASARPRQCERAGEPCRKTAPYTMPILTERTSSRLPRQSAIQQPAQALFLPLALR